MATDAVLARLKRVGQGYLQPAAGLAAMQAVLYSMAACSPSPAVIAINPFNWPAYTAAMTPIPHFFAQLAAPAAASATAGSHADVTAAADSGRDAAAPGTAALSPELVLGQVQAALQSIIGEGIGLEEPLMSAGLDSLGSVEFANVLSRRFGMQMPATLVFDYPTVNAVAAYLHAKLQALAPIAAESAKAPGVSAVPVSLPVPVSANGMHSVSTAVAILAAVSHPTATASHSCGDIAWEQDHITPIPDTRWDADTAHHNPSMQARFGSFLKDVELFDSAAFGLSAAEGTSMDPQQRCLLQCTAEVLHGVNQSSVRSRSPTTAVDASRDLSRAGVFVGISWTEYAKMASMHGIPVGAYTAQSAVLSVAPGELFFAVYRTSCMLCCFPLLSTSALSYKYGLC